MTKKFLIAGPLALAAGALLVTPASAASFSNPGQIRAEIQQLDRQVDRSHGRAASGSMLKSTGCRACTRATPAAASPARSCNGWTANWAR